MNSIFLVIFKTQKYIKRVIMKCIAEDFSNYLIYYPIFVTKFNFHSPPNKSIEYWIKNHNKITSV